VTPGTALLRLEDTRRFELEVRVDESRAARIALKASVPAVDGPDGPLTLVGQVARSPAQSTRFADPPVTIALSAPGVLTPGMWSRRVAGPAPAPHGSDAPWCATGS
jgi:hypothetical protein